METASLDYHSSRWTFKLNGKVKTFSQDYSEKLKEDRGVREEEEKEEEEGQGQGEGKVESSCGQGR